MAILPEELKIDWSTGRPVVRLRGLKERSRAAEQTLLVKSKKK